jgi:hypothetical protein
MGVAAVQFTVQPGMLSRAAGAAMSPILSESVGTLQDTRAAVVQSKEILAAINTQVKNNDDNLAANSEAIASALKILNDILYNSQIRLFGGPVNCKDTGRRSHGNTVWACEQTPGIFARADTLLATLNGSITDLTVESRKVLNTADASIKPLKDVLEELAELEVTLNEQVAKNGTASEKLIGKMTALADKAEVLLADPEIKKTLANVQKTTYHAGEVMETTDIALRSLREKLGRVRFVLKQVTDHLKAVIALH